mgnify:CR=1 FL=1
MTCYAVAHLRNVAMGSEIVAYLEAIDATLAPFEGDLIVIAFPDPARAQAWYSSPAYQAIQSLHERNSEGEVFLIDGVDADHKAADIISC